MDRTRQRPVRQADQIQADMPYLFGSLAGRQRTLHGQVAGGWRPHLEVYETGDALVVRAELAGIEESALDVIVQGRLLRISGVRRRERSGGRRIYHQMEIAYGPFAAEIYLPFPIDPEQVEATYAGGTLEITLPKIPPQRIAPHSAGSAAGEDATRHG
jgi:HSP20 family protein